jgi:hypothetical protein
MDLTALYQSLQAADTSAQKENPFAPTQDVADQLGGLIIKNAGNYDAGETAVAGLLAGLLSGGAQNLGNSYRAKQNELAQQVLSGSLTERPSGMDPSVFAGLNNTRSLFQLSQATAAAERKQAKQDKLQELVTGEVIKGTFDNPYKAKKAASDPEVRSLLKAVGIALDEPAAAAPSATDSTLAADATPATGAKSYDQFMEEAQGNESIAGKMFDKQLEQPEKNLDRITTLRKEFSGLPEVQTFKMSDTGFKSMLRALQDPTATSDVELTRAAIQAIEPGLAVRTDDQSAISQSASLPDSYKAMMSRALTGESGLTADVRNGLYRIAARRYNANGAKFNELKNFYAGQAAAISPNGKDSITPYGDFAPVNDLFGLPDGPATLEDAVGNLLPKKAVIAQQPAAAAPAAGGGLAGLIASLPAGTSTQQTAGGYITFTLPSGQSATYKDLNGQLQRVK